MRRHTKTAARYVALYIAVSLLIAPTISAFAPSKQFLTSRASRNHHPAVSATRQQQDLSITETTRSSRRDVFSYDLWVEHRSPDRFIGNLVSTFQSPIVIHLLADVLNMGLFATAICVYNALCVTGYDDWSGIHHESIVNWPLVQLPSVVFGLTTPFLALLLGTFMASLAKYL